MAIMHMTMVGCVLWAAKSIPNIQAEIWNFVNWWHSSRPRTSLDTGSKAVHQITVGKPNLTTTPATPSQNRVKLLLRALRHRNFQLFFVGQLVSLTGTWMQTVAQSWLVYKMTGSSLLLGTVGFASQIPVFLLAPIAGAVADRVNKHRVVVATQSSAMVLAAMLTVLTFTGEVQVWHIIVLSSMLGIVNAFDVPARQAFIVEMVGKEDLMNAIALNSSMFNGARVVGPAVAGILVAQIGEAWCFFANSVSYIAVIAGLLMMTLPRKAPASSDASAMEQIVEGFRYVRTTKPVVTLLLLVGLISLVGMPYTVLMPIFADQILHGGASGLGILMGATGTGALLGALTLATRSGLKGISRWIAMSCAGFGASLIVFSFSKSFWLSVAVLVPAGFSMMLQMACTNTLLQTMVPDRLRGRVMAFYSMMVMGMAPFGALFAGAVANRLGAPLTVAVGASTCVVGAGIFYGYIPKFRTETRKLIVAQGLSSGEPPQQLGTQKVSDEQLQSASD
jgi:MFS family permease